MVYIKNLKQEIVNNVPQGVDCRKFTTISRDAVIQEYLSNIRTGLIGCYCEKDFNTIYEKFSEANGSYICLEYFKDKSLISALPYFIVIIIIAINLILRKLFLGDLFYLFFKNLNKKSSICI